MSETKRIESQTEKMQEQTKKIETTSINTQPIVINIGQIVSGKYKIEKIIAQSGEATVYLCNVKSLKEKVILKLYNIGFTLNIFAIVHLFIL